MISRKTRTIRKLLFYSLLALDLGLLGEICWINLGPEAQAQTSSPWPELDKNGNPISFNVGGGGQVLKRAFCSTVTNGAATSFTVPNPANTQPAGVYYRVMVRDTSSGLEVLRYSLVSFTGTAFSFDNYAPTSVGSFAPLSGNSVTGNLSVSGNATVTGSITGGSIVSTTLNGANNGNKVTLLNQQGLGSGLTGNSTDQTLYTYTLQANTLGAGKCLRITEVHVHNSGTASVIYKLVIGSTTLITNTYAPNSNSNEDRNVITWCNNSGVTNAQTFHQDSLFNLSGSSTIVPNGGTTGGWISAIDTTQSQAIKFTFNVGNTDQVEARFWMVELIQ